MSVGYFEFVSMQSFEQHKPQRMTLDQLEVGAFYTFLGTNKRIGGVALAGNVLLGRIGPTSQVIETRFVDDDYTNPSDPLEGLITDGFWAPYGSKLDALVPTSKGLMPYTVDYGYLMGAEDNAESRFLSELADRELLVGL